MNLPITMTASEKDKLEEQHQLLQARKRRDVKVTFADGNVLYTDINGTEQEIMNYYLNNEFNLGDPVDPTKDNMQRAVQVEFLS